MPACSESVRKNHAQASKRNVTALQICLPSPFASLRQLVLAPASRHPKRLLGSGCTLQHRQPQGGDPRTTLCFGECSIWLNIVSLTESTPSSTEDYRKLALDAVIELSSCATRSCHESSKFRSVFVAKGSIGIQSNVRCNGCQYDSEEVHQSDPESGLIGCILLRSRHRDPASAIQTPSTVLSHPTEETVKHLIQKSCFTTFGTRSSSSLDLDPLVFVPRTANKQTTLDRKKQRSKWKKAKQAQRIDQTANAGDGDI